MLLCSYDCFGNRFDHYVGDEMKLCSINLVNEAISEKSIVYKQGITNEIPTDWIEPDCKS